MMTGCSYLGCTGTATALATERSRPEREHSERARRGKSSAIPQPLATGSYHRPSSHHRSWKTSLRDSPIRSECAAVSRSEPSYHEPHAPARCPMHRSPMRPNVPVATQQAFLLKPPKVLNEQRLNQTGSPRLRCSFRASGEASMDNNSNPNASSTATASRRPFPHTQPRTHTHTHTHTHT